LVTLAPCIRGSDASALRMRVLVAVSAAAVADSIIKPAAFRSDGQVKKSLPPSAKSAAWASPTDRTGSLAMDHDGGRRSHLQKA
jgi:hypothetical protein